MSSIVVGFNKTSFSNIKLQMAKVKYSCKERRLSLNRGLDNRGNLENRQIHGDDKTADHPA